MQQVSQDTIDKFIADFKAIHPRVFEGETTNALDLYQRQAVTTSKFFWSMHELLYRQFWQRLQGGAEINMKDCETHNLVYLALGLTGESGEYADKVKKILRDFFGEILDPQREALGKELGDVLWYTAVSAAILDYKLSEVADGNALKLAKRRDEGKIGGSGDNR